jgi:maltose O-acetyltransferase
MHKSEKEKMSAGELYVASDGELVELHKRAQELLHRFNSSTPAQIDEREGIIRKLFGSIGAGSVVRPPFFCDYGSYIFAGEKLFVNYDCVIIDCNEVRIGDNVLLAPKVQIYTANHPFEPELRRAELELASPVIIGDDVWIGGGAIICPGVEIGAGTTIGAGSVITKNIPPNVLAAGNPCRVIRALLA